MATIIVVIIIIVLVITANISRNKDISNMKSGEIDFNILITHIAGLNMPLNCHMYVTADDDSIIFSIGNEKQRIKINDIANAEMKTETEMTREITAGRILLAGPLALGWKKKKTINTTYALVEYRVDTAFKKEQIKQAVFSGDVQYQKLMIEKLSQMKTALDNNKSY